MHAPSEHSSLSQLTVALVFSFCIPSLSQMPFNSFTSFPSDSRLVPYYVLVSFDSQDECWTPANKNKSFISSSNLKPPLCPSFRPCAFKAVLISPTCKLAHLIMLFILIASATVSDSLILCYGDKSHLVSHIHRAE